MAIELGGWRSSLEDARSSGEFDRESRSNSEDARSSREFDREWLVGYLLGQPAHHGLPEHPAITTGSCYPDLIGARVVPGMTMPILRALPRFRLRDACPHVSLPEVELLPVSLDVVRAAGAARLVAAVGRALAVGPDLSGKSADVVEARIVATQLATTSGVPLSEMAHVLDIGLDAARRHGARPRHEPTLRAVRLSLALESAVGAAGRRAPVRAQPHGL